MNIQDILIQNAIANGGTPGGLAPGANTGASGVAGTGTATGNNGRGFSGFGGTKGRGLSGLTNTDIFGALGLLSGNGLASLGLNAVGVALDQNSQSVAGHADFGLANTSFGQGLASALTAGIFGQSIADQATAQGFGDLAASINSVNGGVLGQHPDLASALGISDGSSPGFGGFGLGDVDMDGFGVDSGEANAPG